MRTKLTLAALLSLALTGCVIVVADSPDTIKGNGASATETRKIASASALRVENRYGVAMDLDVNVGGAPDLVIEGDSNLLPLVRTEVSGETLRVYTDERLRSSQRIRIRYTAPRLTNLETSGSVHTQVHGLAGGPLQVAHSGSGRLEMRGQVDRLDVRHSGSGQVYADGLESRNAKVTMSGSGRVNIGSVRGDALSVSATGSGSFYARGIVRSLDVQLTGSGSAQLADLRSDEANITSSGSGGIYAWVQQKVEARANGSGRIDVSGNPAQRNVFGRNTSVQ